jgi:hypothetical protein
MTHHRYPRDGANVFRIAFFLLGAMMCCTAVFATGSTVSARPGHEPPARSREARSILRFARLGFCKPIRQRHPSRRRITARIADTLGEVHRLANHIDPPPHPSYGRSGERVDAAFDGPKLRRLRKLAALSPSDITTLRTLCTRYRGDLVRLDASTRRKLEWLNSVPIKDGRWVHRLPSYSPTH